MKQVLDLRPSVSENLPSAADSRRAWLSYRQERGRKSATDMLTAPDHQPKTGKSETATYVLHLAPADSAAGVNLCPWSTAGCRAACLNTAGRGRFDAVQQGRIIKSEFFRDHPAEFLSLIVAEIERAIRKHGRVAIRLNGTSDIRWERVAPWLFTRWAASQVVWYDYTKAGRRTVPENYHLTYSLSERDSEQRAVAMVEQYGRVAVVFDTTRSGDLPAEFAGVPVVDGDKNDQRWQDHGVIVGLRAKGDAIGDTSGFVRCAN